MTSTPTHQDTPLAVWVRTVPTGDGTYRAVLEVGADYAYPLDDDTATAWAFTVLATAADAEHDAAIVAQLCSGDPGAEEFGGEFGGVVTEVRDRRRPRTTGDIVPGFQVEGGVSARDLRPFLHLRLQGRLIGQWTPDDARDHTLKVLEGARAAASDTAYHRTLTAIGLKTEAADALVALLRGHRSGRAQHAVPDDWWIADHGGGPAVWEPEPAGPRRVIAEDLAGWRLWGVLTRVLPDRGTCTSCTTRPCPDHREGADPR